MTKGTAEKPRESRNLFIRAAKMIQRSPGGALVFALLPLVLISYFGWYYWGAEHLDQALYSIRKEKLSVTGQPEWILADVVSEVFESARLDRISLLDPQATATIAHAFESHDWVKRATRVTKSHGGQVQVDLIYSAPAAMVFYAPTRGVFPIDEDGTMLPTDTFAIQFVNDYFVIYADGATPNGEIGMPYGDPRIEQALALAKYLRPVQQSLQLTDIHVVPDQNSSLKNPWLLELQSRSGKLPAFMWGHAPGSESSGELPGEEKLQRLTRWISEELARADGPRQNRVDLRNLPSANPVSGPLQ